MLALLCAGLLNACGTTARKPNVLFILIDTLRADRLGCYGNSRGLTPFIDRFAASASVLRNAYSTSSWTAPAVASLLTSTYPSQHGVVSVVSKLPDEHVTLTERLAAAGYRTAAIVANDVVSPRIGYDRGFEVFRNVGPNAEPVRTHALEWLDGLEGDAPVFLYLHLMDPHWPYTPPQAYVDRLIKPGFDGAAAVLSMHRTIGPMFMAQYVTGVMEGPRRFTCEDVAVLEGLYDAEVAATDAHLERLFAELDGRGFLADTVVIITSDHGEEFYDHGSFWHAYTLYEESIRVPLIVRVPEQARGRVVTDQVSLVDVTPTILHLLGLSTPTGMQGQSFARLVDGSWWPAPREWWRRRTQPAAVFAELEGESPRQPQRRVHSAALVEPHRKVLVRAHGEPELYDLAADPKEEHRLAAASRLDGQEMLTRLEDTRDTLTQRGEHETVALDAATRERLQALGYGLAEQPSVEIDASTPIPAQNEVAEEVASVVPDLSPAQVHVQSRRELCAPPTPIPAAPVERSYF